MVLVQIMMNVDQWSTVFSDIVAKAMAIEVSAGSAGSYDKALQVISAEFQASSPLVPTRQNQFVRYCRQLASGFWAVVDLSLYSFKPGPTSNGRRRPSGVLIHELPNGYSLVTWIEHAEVDDRRLHDLYKPIVQSGITFGAQRWIEILNRQCERRTISMASNIPSVGVDILMNIEGRKNILKMAERMVSDFHCSIGASTVHIWTTLSAVGSDSIRVRARQTVNNSGIPSGHVLSAVASFWVPSPPKTVFGYLRDKKRRGEWDMLTNEAAVEELIYVATGRNEGNCLSLLRTDTTRHNNMLILQESHTDSTGSYLIHAPVGIDAVNGVLNGGNPDLVPLLPSGFAVLPDGGSGGSLLTVVLQILLNATPAAKLSLGSLTTVNELIRYIVEKVKAAVSSQNS